MSHCCGRVVYVVLVYVEHTRVMTLDIYCPSLTNLFHLTTLWPFGWKNGDIFYFLFLLYGWHSDHLLKTLLFRRGNIYLTFFLLSEAIFI